MTLEMLNECVLIYRESENSDDVYSHHELLCNHRDGRVSRIMIDAEIFDFLIIMDYKWSINKGGYAYCRALGYLHHYVMKFNDIDIFLTSRSDKMMIDHINRNKLDNRKQNLRWVSASGNAFNRSISVLNSSGYKNLKQDNRGRWILTIRGKVVEKFLDLGPAIIRRDHLINLLTCETFSIK